MPVLNETPVRAGGPVIKTQLPGPNAKKAIEADSATTASSV